MNAHQKARAAALDHLHCTIGEHIENRDHIPCLKDANVWLSEDLDDQEQAAEACGGCSALDECRNYVTNHAEPSGVWAGMTPTQRSRRKRDRDD